MGSFLGTLETGWGSCVAAFKKPLSRPGDFGYPVSYLTFYPIYTFEIHLLLVLQLADLIS